MFPSLAVACRCIGRVLAVVVLVAALAGCAIYYRDPNSGAEHVWGFGHLAVKVTPPFEGKQAIIHRATLTGVAIGTEQGSLGISVGYDRKERITIYDESTAIAIQRPPGNDFFYFRIGTLPPGIILEKRCNDTSDEREEKP